MSKIQEQIKALQTKQKKIEYLSYVADLIKNDTKCVDFKDVQKDIVAKIEPFLLDLMTEVESGESVKKDSPEQLTSEEIKVLKTVVNSIVNRKAPEVNVQLQTQNTPAPQEPQKPAPPKPPSQELGHADKMAFALGNRHLADKRVQVINDKNVQILGKVVGLDAPFVIVKTDTGPTINVPIEKVALV